MAIRLSLREGGFAEIAGTPQRCDPLAYALIRPKGDHGRPLGAPNELGAENVSPSEFAAYRLMLRAEIPNHLHHFGRLFRQYVCGQLSEVETHWLRYVRFHQGELRSASYRQVQHPPQVSTTGGKYRKARNPPSDVLIMSTGNGGSLS